MSVYLGNVFRRYITAPTPFTNDEIKIHDTTGHCDGALYTIYRVD